MANPSTSVSRAAYYLALIGGILMVVFGLLGLAVSAVGEPFFHWGFAFGSLVTLVLGVVAIVLAKNAAVLVWSIVLIVIGLLGGGIGGLLVLVGGIIGLVASIAK
ncbi:MAG TPA: hypothetical protein VEH08_03905 [Methanomassiliicoccales archaeon]|nr:hypothetical protein [Methanomassiliicoccales archaeon]